MRAEPIMVSEPVPHDRTRVRIGRRGVLLAAAAGVVAGLVTGLVEPRGPITLFSAVLTMVVGLFVGLLIGWFTGRRWPVWIAAAGYVVAVEALRWNLPGPTTDAFRLDSLYGLLAAIITRGFHGLLAFLPMLFGAALAVWLLRRREAREAGQRAGRPIGTVILGIVSLALLALVARPAGTPPVLTAAGAEVPGSIAELATVPVGQTEQTVMIRAADANRPVLLYLSGGPGQSDLALSRALTTGWVNDFVFANLEQRGNGKSYAAIDPVSDMTIDRAVSDVIEVSEYLRDRFGEQKIYLMGESWGTILGVLAVQQRPDLYHAYIGSGQMVDIVETDQRIYADLQEYAERTGDGDLAASLDDIGAPPYRDIPWANANLLTWYDYLYRDYEPSAGYVRRGDESGLDPFGVMGTEYTLVEKMTVLRGLIDTFALMYPQLYDIDLRQEAPSLQVPVYVLDGKAELDGRRDLSLTWFRMLKAPDKKLTTYPDAAHSVAFEQADAVQELFRTEILPATYGSGRR